MRRAPLILTALGALSCGRLFVGPGSGTSPLALFDEVWSEVDRHYAFFVLKGIDWDSLGEVYRPAASAAATDDVLAQTIGTMLGELKDVHVNLYTPQRQYRYTGYDSLPAAFDETVVRGQYVTEWRRGPNGRLRFGHAATDVGYIWIPSFGGTGFGPDIDAALAGLPGVRAWIVDVRQNGGGSNQNSGAVAGRFADRERSYALIQYRDGPRHDDFTPLHPVMLSPAGARRFAGPVVVITDRRDFSATEDFVLAMRSLPTVTIVGDTTGGGAGNPLTRELPNGWTYRFSEWIEYAPDTSSYEGIGLAPDLWVRNSTTELAAGRDAMLDSALVVARRAATRLANR